MKRFSLLPFVVASGVFGLASTASWAETTSETDSLREDVRSLRQEVASLKQELKSRDHHPKHHKKHHLVKNAPARATQSMTEPATDDNTWPFDPYMPGRSFVSIGPYIGLPFSYSGSNLIINSPSVNVDMQLLNLRQKIMSKLNTSVGNLAGERYPYLLLSGVIESQALYKSANSINHTDIDLTNVSLDLLLFGPSRYITGFVEFSYDNNPTFQQTRVSQSRVFVNKAFVTIGNFDCSPLYATIGQYYAPFGTYSSSFVSDPLTKLVARTKIRGVTVGANGPGDNAPYGALYVFKGDSYADSGDNINNGGVNLGYRFAGDGFNGDVGAGWIRNLADSNGMQFSGFLANEQLQHRVPAQNWRGRLSLGQHYDFIAEYVGALQSFNPMDMSMNSHGAKPWATNFEASYSFMILTNKPSSIGLNYGQSHDALGLQLPRQTYAAVFNTSLWHHTLQSLEVRRNNRYDGTAEVASTNTVTQNGSHDYAVTLQFDYYF